jgi:hypothetical protein
MQERIKAIDQKDQKLRKRGKINIREKKKNLNKQQMKKNGSTT